LTNFQHLLYYPLSVKIRVLADKRNSNRDNCGSRFKVKTERRINIISRQIISVCHSAPGRLGLKLKNFQTKIYHWQANFADLIRERRTIKLLHILRNYSALAVVVSSAILVIATNLAAGKESRGFLFGHWNGDEEVESPRKNKISGQVNRESGLVFVPLARASAAVDVAAKKDDGDGEEVSIIQGNQGQVMVANDSPVLKDPQEGEGVIIYEVEEGDTVSSIAAAHNITVNTILWANDIENIDSIMPGDKLFILPVAGLDYVIKKGDTLDAIAKKYKAEKDKIIAFNDLPANGKVEEGQKIIIPGGKKEIPRSKISSSRIARRQYIAPSRGISAVSGWKKLEGKAGTGHKFPYGYCTWYVSKKRYVPWGGNAGTWLYHAKVNGYKTGKAPKKGAIIVTSESWWGHVGIVEKVGKGTVTISEMNHRGWGRVSRRTLSSKSRVIKGYIY